MARQIKYKGQNIEQLNNLDLIECINVLCDKNAELKKDIIRLTKEEEASPSPNTEPSPLTKPNQGD